jgi:hypothetical protein
MRSQLSISESSPGLMPRLGALAAIVGTLIYMAMSILHGNPPIDDPAKMLSHVAERPWWRIAHLANIFAVLLWLAALSTFTGSLRHEEARGLGRVSQAIMTCASAVFAVYFGIHGFGFSALADRWVEVTAPGRGALLTETNAVLTLLGSVAFTAQALLGLSILLYGLTVTLAAGLPKWLGGVGVVAGAGWMIGAVLVSFEIIVPFTVLSWLWMIALGVLLWAPGATQSMETPTG